ncbi:MAG: DedA family protein [Oleispira sp.]|nr:DedA family protein [Oleispira sp.]MBL4880090.1 DedA family protein [Oleispira sp.]
MDILALFLSALIAATLFPMGSEVLLIALLSQDKNEILLWFVATLGNVLGSVINYGLGFWASDYLNKKYQHAKSWKQAQAAYNRYGSWSLLFAWLPIIGDPITLIAGLARTRFSLFILLVVIGKGARYALLIALAQVATSQYPF